MLTRLHFSCWSMSTTLHISLVDVDYYNFLLVDVDWEKCNLVDREGTFHEQLYTFLHLFSFEMKRRQKQENYQKHIFTCFWLWAASKSWSKYTTLVFWVVELDDHSTLGDSCGANLKNNPCLNQLFYVKDKCVCKITCLSPKWIDHFHSHVSAINYNLIAYSVYSYRSIRGHVRDSNVIFWSIRALSWDILQIQINFAINWMIKTKNGIWKLGRNRMVTVSTYWSITINNTCHYTLSIQSLISPTQYLKTS